MADTDAPALPASDVGKALTPGFATDTPPSAQSKPAGSDGVTSFGGFLWTGEQSRKLQQRTKWVTYDDTIANIPIVASAVRIWTDLGGSAKWTAEINPSGDKNAERGKKIVEDGLLNARLSKPWRQIAKRQLMKKFRGFAMHEGLPKKRSDGQIVYGDIQHRPQWTIYRWDIPDEQTPWRGVEQWTRTGERYAIDRARLFYSAEDTLTDSPDGVGVLRHVVEACDILRRYWQLEGIAYDTNMAGMPFARAPIAKLIAQCKTLNPSATDAQIKTYVLAQTEVVGTLLTGHIKTIDQSLLLDSQVYTTTDTAHTPSTIPEWDFTILRGQIEGLPEIATAIGRLLRDVARVMSAEFLLLGGEDSGGSYSMHEDKTAMFRLSINSSLDDVGDDATRDLAYRLVALNGLDPDTCTPTVKAAPLATQSVEAACRSLQLLGQAGAMVRPQWKGVDILYGRMDLPPQPELTPAELGMLTRTPKPAQPTAGQNDAADLDGQATDGTTDSNDTAPLAEAMGAGGGYA